MVQNKKKKQKKKKKKKKTRKKMPAPSLYCSKISAAFVARGNLGSYSKYIQSGKTPVCVVQMKPNSLIAGS